MSRGLLAVGAIGLAAVLAACGASGSSATKADGFDPIQCSGDVAVMAPYGGLGTGETVQMNWARVALDKFNEAHGTAFTLRPSNVDGDEERAVKAAREIAAEDNVIGVVGPKTSVDTRAAGPIFDAKGLVYLSASATNATLTDGSLKNFYRVVASDALQAPAMAEFIAREMDPSTVLVVRDDEAYSQGLAEGLVKTLDEFKIRNFIVDVKQDQRSYADVVNRVDPMVNVVALPVLETRDAMRIIKQLHAAGKYPKLIGGDALFMQSFSEPGAFVTTYAPDTSELAEAKEMTRLYQTIFGDFERYGAPTYVAMEVILKAAYTACREHGEVKRADVLKQVPKTKLEASILGMPISFTATHELRGATTKVYMVGPRGFELVD